MEKLLALGYVILLFLCPYRIKNQIQLLHEQKNAKDILLLILWGIAGLVVYVPLVWFIIRLLLFFLFGYGSK